MLLHSRKPSYLLLDHGGGRRGRDAVWAVAHGGHWSILAGNLDTPTVSRVLGKRFKMESLQKPFPFCIPFLAGLGASSRRLSPMRRIMGPAHGSSGALLARSGAGSCTMCISPEAGSGGTLQPHSTQHGSWAAPILLP